MGLITAERRYLPSFREADLDEEKKRMQKVLVPLDGSSLAEESLFVAQTISRAFDSEVTLLTVTSEVSGGSRSGSVFSGGLGYEEEGENKRYLQRVAAQLYTNGVQAQSLVCDGPVVEAIGTHARDGQDLIVMSTNGRSGFKRLVMGSVANKVVQTSDTPILLLKPMDGWRSRGTGFERLLVALDGSTYSERVLPYVRMIAQNFSSDVTLLTVPVGNSSDAYREQLGHYLQGVADELRGDGVQAKIMVTGNGPARTIVNIGQEQMIDLIMLATHGRGGFDRLMMGSVAYRVIEAMPCPLFLVPKTADK